MRLVMIFVYVFLVSGCFNPYASHYKDLSGGLDVAKHPNVDKSFAEPQLLTGPDMSGLSIRLQEDGYKLIGHSTFEGYDYSESRAINHANDIHSSVVLFSKKYIKSEPIYSITGWNPITGYTTGSKYAADVFKYDVSYWVKLKKFRAGITPRDLTDSEKHLIQSNKGIAVVIVIRKTSGFDAGFLRGDLITHINNEQVIDKNQYYTLIEKYEGSTVGVRLIRDGDEMYKWLFVNKLD